MCSQSQSSSLQQANMEERAGLDSRKCQDKFKIILEDFDRSICIKKYSWFSKSAM